MCKSIAFGCTTDLGSASFAVAYISTAFEDLACNHAMDVVMNKLYYYYLNVVSWMTASCYSGLVYIVHVQTCSFWLYHGTGCTSLAVANISTYFEDLVCNHAMYVTKNNIQYHILNVVSYMTASYYS